MRVADEEHSKALRPALGVLFVAAVCGWISAIFMEQLTWSQFAGEADIEWLLPALGGCASVALIAGLSCVLAHGRRLLVLGAAFRSGLGVASLSCAAIALCCLLYWQDWASDVDYAEALFDSGKAFDLELTGDPAQRDYGVISNAHLDFDGRSFDIRLLWPGSGSVEPVTAGHCVQVRGHLSVPKPDDGGRWNHQNGYVGMLNATSVEQTDGRLSLRSLVSDFRDESFERIKQCGGDGAALLAGVLIGNRTLYADTELEQAFKTTGLAHLMAVSGTHLALVTMLVSSLLKILRCTRAMRAVATLAMLILYVALTCFAASAIRACVMCAVALILGSTKRRRHVLSGLALCVFAFIGLSPPMAFSLGFSLSALSVCGLIVFQPLAESWMACLFSGHFEKVSSSIAATLAATLMTVPVTVPMFAQLPLISPLANIMAAPFLTALLTVGLLGLLVCAFLPAVGAALLQFCSGVVTLCATLVQTLADIPLACIPLSVGSESIGVIFAILLVVLWVLWPLPRVPSEADYRTPQLHKRIHSFSKTAAVLVTPLFLVIVLGFGIRLPSASSSRVVMLDVGQGDCMLIESAGHHVLVDTGEFGDVLQRGLARQGVTHLDAVILTHKDADHCGALKSLSGVVDVDHVYIHADLLDKDFEKSVLESARWVTNGRGAEGLRPGARIGFGEFTLTMLAPQNGGRSENEDSLVNLVEYDAKCDGSIEARALLTGDAESGAIAPVVKRVGGIDVFKVPHHGSKDGVTKDELVTLHPRIALIGVGVDNEYGHPKLETLKLLQEAGTQVYRTDLQGDITLSFSSSGISVITQK